MRCDWLLAIFLVATCFSLSDAQAQAIEHRYMVQGRYTSTPQRLSQCAPVDSTLASTQCCDRFGLGCRSLCPAVDSPAGVMVNYSTAVALCAAQSPPMRLCEVCELGDCSFRASVKSCFSGTTFVWVDGPPCEPPPDPTPSPPPELAAPPGDLDQDQCGVIRASIVHQDVFIANGSLRGHIGRFSTSDVGRCCSYCLYYPQCKAFTIGALEPAGALLYCYLYGDPIRMPTTYHDYTVSANILTYEYLKPTSYECGAPRESANHTMNTLDEHILSAASLDECCDRCVSHPSCFSYTYRGFGEVSTRCRLFDSLLDSSLIRPDLGYTSANIARIPTPTLTNAPSPSPTAPPVAAPATSPLVNGTGECGETLPVGTMHRLGFQRYLAASWPMTLQECCDKCADNSKCWSYSFGKFLGDAETDVCVLYPTPVTTPRETPFAGALTTNFMRTVVDPGRGLAAVGCDVGTNIMTYCRSKDQLLNTRCCSMSGDSCRSLCSEEFDGRNANFSTAQALCAAQNPPMRLCSLFENNQCCSDLDSRYECSYNLLSVWVSDDTCKPKEENFDCPDRNIPTPTPTNAPSPSPTASPSPAPTNVPSPVPTPVVTESPFFCGAASCPNLAEDRMFASFRVTLEDGSSGSRPVLADFDQDGDIDIFVHDINSSSILLNDGGGVFTRTPLNSTLWPAPRDVLSSAAVDFNADGFPDIVTCGIGYVGYLRHCGTACPVRGFRFNYVVIDDTVDIVARCPVVLTSANAAIVEKSTSASSPVPRTGVRAVVAFTGRTISIFEATGTLANPEWTLQTPVYGNASCVAGVVGEVSNERPFANREFRELVWVESARRSSVHVGEVPTGLLTAGSGPGGGVVDYVPQVVIFDATAMASSSASQHQMSDLAIADIDNDGRADIVAASTHAASVFWLRNSPSGGVMELEKEQYVLDGESSGVESVDVADVDRDGFTDIIVSSRHTIQWCKNRPAAAADGAFSDGCEYIGSASAPGQGRVAFSNVGMGDLDGDGDLDLVASAYFFAEELERVVWFENLRTPENDELISSDNVDASDDVVNLNAGEIVGVVIGALVLGFALAFFLFQCHRLRSDSAGASGKREGAIEAVRHR